MEEFQNSKNININFSSGWEKLFKTLFKGGDSISLKSCFYSGHKVFDGAFSLSCRTKICVVQIFLILNAIKC